MEGARLDRGDVTKKRRGLDRGEVGEKGRGLDRGEVGEKGRGLDRDVGRKERAGREGKRERERRK